MRVLVTEGSSLSARETITALGLAGHEIVLCGSRTVCIGRFSRFVRRFILGPAPAKDPAAFFRFVMQTIERERVAVLVPSHEEALIFSKMLPSLEKRVAVALPRYESYLELLSKARFTAVLAKLGLPSPKTLVLDSIEVMEKAAFYPSFLKTEYGTASAGVWRLESFADLHKVLETGALSEATNASSRLLLQERAPGALEAGYAEFDHGELVAFHASRRIIEGARGGRALNLGVERVDVARHFAAIGKHLDWHGPLAIDYLYDENDKIPRYIDASPRLCEPGAALAHGVDLPSMQVAISLGIRNGQTAFSSGGVKSHAMLQALLGSAERGATRRDLFRLSRQIESRRGEYEGSIEELTPTALDPLSALPLAFVKARLLARPSSAATIAGETVGAYAMDVRAVKAVEELTVS